ncbi:MAG: hypothetical protein KF791_20555 [Verrucomicrobiae bacterium]|nr:hypothetical protein [Verrucomicrobiae bacterium]
MKLIVLILLASFSPISLRAQPIADSVAEFSNIQGGNNWYYGYYDLTSDTTPGYDATNDFTEFPVFGPADFTGNAWRISGSFWTQITAGIVHPNADGDNGGRTPAEHWAIRRWVSETTALVRVYGHVAKHAPGGDGTQFTVFVNGRKVFERFVPASDIVGTEYSFGVGLNEGDLVDFALTAAGGIYFDGTSYSVRIEPADFTLTAATAFEIGTPTITGKTYQLERSVDLQTWVPVGEPFEGTGAMVYHLFSTRGFGSLGHFRAEVLP